MIIENIRLYLNTLRFLLRNNLIPAASIVKDPTIDLSSNFLDFNLKYPIGLGPGIDLIGNGLSNLNKLGFEFIEIGPLTDAMENPQKAKITYNKDKKGKNEFQQTFYRSFINLEKNTITRKENERNRLMFLFNQKEIVKKQIVDNHEKYSYVDKIFTREIEIAEKNQNAFWFLCWYYFPFCSKTKQKYISLDNIFE